MLSPGFFLHERLCLFVEAMGGHGQPTLVFPVDAETKPEEWTSWTFDEQALSNLVGPPARRRSRR